MIDHPDSFRDDDAPRSSQPVLDAVEQAQRVFDPWLRFCMRIDRIIGAATDIASSFENSGYVDQEFDLFWSSREILKPAIYSRAAVPAVAPMFSDRDMVATTASEMIERCLVSTFKRSDFNDVMLGVRDGLIDCARGVPRIVYESGEGKGKRVCFEYVDRADFIHDPARRWSEVGWVAFASHLTERQATKRFGAKKAQLLTYGRKRNEMDGERIGTAEKARVLEVWHKADNRVYWVSEGVDELLDEKPPFLDLEGFWPCPPPAYGTLRPGTLVPVPDYTRYERTLEQINELTRRVHALLQWIRVRGLIPAGGDAATAVESALAQQNDDVLLIPVPGAALMQGSGQFVQFLPLQEFAAAITGLLEARRELIQNYYELSGISDIMRGATNAQETLGAQELKSQYGSVRVREKIDALQCVAKNVAQITAEIMCEKFDQKTLLDMSQMDLPTAAEVKRRLKDLTSTAERELDALTQQAEAAMRQAQVQGQQIPPEQAEQQFQQAQQQIIAKYQPQIDALGKQVTIDAVMELIRDQKARAFSVEIATDSTIAPDEQAEKASRAEFLQAFSGTVAAIQPVLAMGEAGAKLAGEMLKFSLAPFRAGRQLDAAIDDFVEAAPAAMAAMAQGGQGEDMAALAEAEMEKAKAQMAKVEADSMLKQAELQQRMTQMQIDTQEKQAKMQLEQGKLELAAAKQEQEFAAKMAEMDAKQNLMQAQTAKILAEIGLDARKQDLEEYRTASDVQMAQADTMLAVEGMQQDAKQREVDTAIRVTESERSANMGERQQSFAERQAQGEKE